MADWLQILKLEALVTSKMGCGTAILTSPSASYSWSSFVLGMTM